MVAPFFADLVRETSFDVGAGALVLAGAVPGHRGFSGVVPANATFHYAIAGVTHAGEWETGSGTLDSAGRLVRSLVAASSTGGSPVALSAGLKTVALVAGADWFADQGAATSDHGAAIDALSGTVTGLMSGVGAGTFASGSAAAPGVRFAGSTGAGWFAPAANCLGGATSGAERLRVTALGHVGIGTASPAANLVVSNNGEFGFEFNVQDRILQAVDRVAVALADFTLAGLEVRFRSGAGGTERLRVESSGAVRPGEDNGQTLGSASFRWSVIHAGSGVINTSDARAKQWRGPMTAAEVAAARRIVTELGFYQWHAAIASKGAGNARWHFGVRAQAVWQIMADAGLIAPMSGDGRASSARYAFLCFDAGGDADAGQFGVRSDQLALFLIAGQQVQIDTLTAAMPAAAAATA